MIPQPKSLKGVERAVDAYFKSPTLRFGYGKRDIWTPPSAAEDIPDFSLDDEPEDPPGAN